jgi:hypothetical protein
MGQQPQSSSKENTNASKDDKSTQSITAPDTGLQHLKQGLVKDAGDLGGGLKTLATGVADEAKHAVEGQLSSQKSRVVEGLAGVAQAIRHVRQGGGGQSDESPISPALMPYIDQAADQVERASAYFDKKSLGEVASDVEGFARREPALFLGGAFALGLLGGRFLKASRPASTGSTAGAYARAGSSRGGRQNETGRDRNDSFGRGQNEAAASGNRSGNGNDAIGNNAGRAAFDPNRDAGKQDKSKPESGSSWTSPSGSPPSSSNAKDRAAQNSGGTTPGTHQGSSRGVTGNDGSEKKEGAPNLGANQGGAPQEITVTTSTNGNLPKDGKSADGKSYDGKTVAS